MRRVLVCVLLLSAFGCEDFSDCTPTDHIVERERAAWVQIIPAISSGNVRVPQRTIVHPKRRWKEQLYQCPDGPRFKKIT